MGGRVDAQGETRKNAAPRPSQVASELVGEPSTVGRGGASPHDGDRRPPQALKAPAPPQTAPGPWGRARLPQGLENVAGEEGRRVHVLLSLVAQRETRRAAGGIPPEAREYAAANQEGFIWQQKPI